MNGIFLNFNIRDLWTDSILLNIICICRCSHVGSNILYPNYMIDAVFHHLMNYCLYIFQITYLLFPLLIFHTTMSTTLITDPELLDLSKLTSSTTVQPPTLDYDHNARTTNDNSTHPETPDLHARTTNENSTNPETPDHARHPIRTTGSAYVNLPHQKKRFVFGDYRHHSETEVNILYFILLYLQLTSTFQSYFGISIWYNIHCYF